MSTTTLDWYVTYTMQPEGWSETAAGFKSREAALAWMAEQDYSKGSWGLEYRNA